MSNSQGQCRNYLSDCFFFARAWFHNPRQVGAVAPSSAVLADLITKSIAPCCAPVIELGPGTGVFTRALLARGVPEESISLVECDPTFVDMLEHEFPRSRILCLDAARLRTLQLFGGEQAGAAISGLPLLAMSSQKVFAILSAVFSHMREDAVLYQFTYGLGCPVQRSIRDRLGLQFERMGSAYANLPPATVYRIWRPRKSREKVVSLPERLLAAPVITSDSELGATCMTTSTSNHMHQNGLVGDFL